MAQEYKKNSLKKHKNWRKKLADFHVPNKIQSGEYSMDGGKDGFLRESGRSASRRECELEWRWLELECEFC